MIGATIAHCRAHCGIEKVSGSIRLGSTAGLLEVGRNCIQARDSPWIWNPGKTSPEGVAVAPQKLRTALQIFTNS